MSAERGFRLHFGVVTAVLLAATLAVGVLVSLGSAILVLAGGMLLLVIALLWNSVQSLTGESPLSFEEALSLGAPSAEEEQKRAVLRALKDLDYERSVGKLSEEDYAALSGRYRAEAKRLLKLIEEQRGPEHERIERLVRERLAKEPDPPPETETETDADAEPPPSERPRTRAADQGTAERAQEREEA
ncbi:MAG TPA: hypothetical protein VKZ49_08330 [Polyangiaceae bacterium]|nr:hypothetical protein [Polyangiaceae bacterium]